MYAAFVDTDTGKIDVWLAIGSGQFEQLPDPFPGKSFSAHPRLRGSSGLLGLGWLTALDDSGNLWLNSFSPHLGGWGSPRLVASGVSNGAHGVKLRDGTKIRENGGFAFDVGGFDLGEIVNPPIPFEARFWYPTYVDGFMVLKGARCDLHSTAPCQSPPNWTTPAGFNSFLPAVAVATQRFPSTQPIFHWKMSYVTEERSPVGQVTVASIDFNLNIPSGDGTRSFPFGTQTPCPDGRGYWGDYDDMQVIGNDGILPAFVRPFTDSTDGVCTKQFFKASPQHISQVTLPLIHAGVKPTGGGICKADESGLSLIAVFGYNNPNSFDVSLPVGAKNKFTGRGIAENQGQPTTFSPGHHSGIRVSFRAGEGPPAWTLDGTTVEAEIGPRGLQSCHPLLEF